jgi:hypothetical protein
VLAREAAVVLNVWTRLSGVESGEAWRSLLKEISLNLLNDGNVTVVVGCEKMQNGWGG